MKRPPPDPVDIILDEWRRVRPDLELRPMGVMGRMARLFALGQKAVAGTLSEHGLDIGEFDVLAALRRAGPPYQRTPTELARSLMLSTGAMTNRIDKLERAGMVQRHHDPEDRRGIIVALSRSGLAKIDAAVTDHVANEARLLSGLTESETIRLDQLLGKWLRSLESGGGEADSEDPAL